MSPGLRERCGREFPLAKAWTCKERQGTHAFHEASATVGPDLFMTVRWHVMDLTPAAVAQAAADYYSERLDAAVARYRAADRAHPVQKVSLSQIPAVQGGGVPVPNGPVWDGGVECRVGAFCERDEGHLGACQPVGVARLPVRGANQ